MANLDRFKPRIKGCPMDTKSALERARQEAKQGNRRKAREILREAAKSDPKNEEIYLLFAQVADSRVNAIKTLEYVLRLNPNNQTARSWLDKMQQTPVSVEPSMPPKSKPKRWLWGIAVGVVLVSLFSIIVVVFGPKSEKPSEGIAIPEATTVVQASEEPIQQPTSPPEPTPIPPTFTPQPIGLSRSNPFASSDLVSAPNWDILVIEVIRGDGAWQAIQAVNPLNEPAPEGMEYLLLKLRVKCTYADSDEHPISGADFKVTGDRLIRYSTAFAVDLDPQLEAFLYSGGETEGWSSYLVGVGESNLILIVDELFGFTEENLRFIALDEGASISVPPELSGISPNELGIDRMNPAAFGEKVITEDWEITILGSIRGEEAWTLALNANQFNEPPAEGLEYIALRIHVRYIGTEDKSVHIDDTVFKTTGSENIIYELPMIVEPEPVFDVSLFPGGETEGWVILLAAKGETGIVAVFEPLWDFSGTDKRFLSLEP